MFVHAHVTMDIQHIIFIQQLSHPNLNNVKKVWSFDFSNDIHVAIHKCNNSIFDYIYLNIMDRQAQRGIQGNIYVDKPYQ